MPSDWHDSARRLFEESPDLAGRILRDLLQVDLPPVIQYTLLTSPGRDKPGAGKRGGDEPWEDEPRGDDEAPGPGMVILAGPPRDPVRLIVVEFQQGRDDLARRRWPLHRAATWLRHGRPADLLVICPDDLTAHWADRPIATTLDGYVCRPAVLVLEDLGPIAA